MDHSSQAVIEERFLKRQKAFDKGELTLIQAFGNFNDWLLELGELKAFFHPNLKQWMWHDRWHDTWNFIGCSIGEAILLSIGHTGGIKKLPFKDKVSNWCICLNEQNLYGPIRNEEIQSFLDTQLAQEKTLVWSTNFTNWINSQDAYQLIKPEN